VDAAIDVFGRHGYHGTSIRDIAERAGLSSAALYHHFSSKQDLLFQIMDRGIEVLVRQTQEAYAAAPPTPEDRLAAIVRVHVLAHTVDPVGSLVGNSELRSLDPENRAVVVEKRDCQQRLFDRVISDGVAEGVFVAPHPRETARAITSMGTAVASWYRPTGPLGPEEIAARYVTLALATAGYRGRD
jgi:AcrR family transcriptional regulator